MVGFFSLPRLPLVSLSVGSSQSWRTGLEPLDRGESLSPTPW